LFRLQSYLSADLGADPAASDAMAGWLSLHHVQRMAQSAEKFSQAYFRQ
jgi:hypothetical protein